MQFIIEAITRRDNLALLRFRTEKDRPVTPVGEFCLWYGNEGLAAAAADDLAEAEKVCAAFHPAVEWGYSRILFDGIGLHGLAPQVYALLEEYPLAAVSVSDIRLGILVSMDHADAVWLKLWAHYGSMLSADRRTNARGPE